MSEKIDLSSIGLTREDLVLVVSTLRDRKFELEKFLKSHGEEDGFWQKRIEENDDVLRKMEELYVNMES